MLFIASECTSEADFQLILCRIDLQNEVHHVGWLTNTEAPVAGGRKRENMSVVKE